MWGSTGHDRGFGPDRIAEWRTVHVVLNGGGGGVVAAERLLVAVCGWLDAAQAAGRVTAWITIRPPWNPPDGSGAEVKFQLRNAARDVLDEIRAVITDHATTGAEVTERGFAPAVGRFGGPDGLDVCMEHFVAASGVTARILTATSDRAGRLSSVAGLLADSAQAHGGGVDDQRTWLLRYAAAQATLPGVLAADLTRARAAAAEALRDGRYERRSGDPRWRALQYDTWAALTRLHEAGRLDFAPDQIYGTLVQIAHNQLGIDAQDNADLALTVASLL